MRPPNLKSWSLLNGPGELTWAVHRSSAQKSKHILCTIILLFLKQRHSFLTVQYLGLSSGKSLVNALSNLLMESPDYLEAEIGQISNWSLICCDTFYYLYVYCYVCSFLVQNNAPVTCYQGLPVCFMSFFSSGSD